MFVFLKIGIKGRCRDQANFFEILEDFQYKSSICSEKVARFD